MRKYQCMFTENQIKVMKMAIEESKDSYSYNGTSTEEVLRLLNNVIRNIKEEKNIIYKWQSKRKFSLLK